MRSMQNKFKNNIKFVYIIVGLFFNQMFLYLEFFFFLLFLFGNKYFCHSILILFVYQATDGNLPLFISYISDQFQLMPNYITLN